MLQEDLESLEHGIKNMIGHLENLRQYNIPVVVAINQFPTDSEAELRFVEAAAMQAGAFRVSRVSCFSHGGSGALQLADAVIEACESPANFSSLYPLELSYQEKLEIVARKVYGAAGISLPEDVQELLHSFEQRGCGGLPVCVAKTQYSFSHDPKQLGRPTGFIVPINEVRLCAGAGFLLAMTEGISLMPGLPKHPAAIELDLTAEGEIVGLKME